MASDPEKPLLRLSPQAAQDRPIGRQQWIPRPEAFPRGRQAGAFSPKFNRLAEVLSRDPTGLELRADPTALAPERLLVFEVRGSINAFAKAVRRIPGLELVDEEELQEDELDKAPVAYLMVPDVRALRDLESLWRRSLDGRLVAGETPWRDVFGLLRDLRPWGPRDRVQHLDANILQEEIDGRAADELVRLEIELVFRASLRTSVEPEDEVRHAVRAQDGRVVSASRIADIAYHALLVDLPVRAVQRIIEQSPDGFAALEPVMHIRPQSAASSVEVAEAEDSVAASPAVAPLGDPILALVDGVPMAAHVLLAAHMVVDDSIRA
jgi:hypothetical protein